MSILLNIQVSFLWFMGLLILYEVKLFVKINKGHRPFACTICNMRFGQKFALRSHVLSHDEEYTEKLRTKLKSIKEGTDISLLSPDS